MVNFKVDSQLAITCSNLTIAILEQGVKYIKWLSLLLTSNVFQALF